MSKNTAIVLIVLTFASCTVLTNHDATPECASAPAAAPAEHQR